MRKLIINADDFGYRTQINKAIIYAYKNGVVRSTSMLVNRDAFDEAVTLAKENPGLGIGLHIDLDKYFNIEHGVGTVNGWINNIVPDQQILKGEIKQQIEKLLSVGIQIDHFDSHHHIHLFPEVLSIVIELCKEYNINKIRFFNKFGSIKLKDRLICNSIKFPEHFIEGWYYGNVDEDYNVAEIMTHPGYCEFWREKELLVCCDALLKEYCQKNSIELINFSNL